MDFLSVPLKWWSAYTGECIHAVNHLRGFHVIIHNASAVHIGCSCLSFFCQNETGLLRGELSEENENSGLTQVFLRSMRNVRSKKVVLNASAL